MITPETGPSGPDAHHPQRKNENLTKTLKLKAKNTKTFIFKFQESNFWSTKQVYERTPIN